MPGELEKRMLLTRGRFLQVTRAMFQLGPASDLEDFKKEVQQFKRRSDKK